MSHVVAFRIDGLAGRETSIEMKLNRDDNIFFGLNGCGKTSLLKILHSAMENKASMLHRVPFTAAEVQIYSKSYDRVFTRSIKKPPPPKRSVPATKRGTPENIRRQLEFDLVHSISLEEDQMQWVCTPAKPKETTQTGWKHEYLPTSRLHIGEELLPLPVEWPRAASQWLTEDQLDAFFARSVEQLWSRYSAQMLGEVRKAQEEGLASILRVVLAPHHTGNRGRGSKLTAVTAYERVKNFLTRQGSASILGSPADFEARYREDATLQDIVQDINSVETQIDQAMASRNTLQQLVTRMFTGNKEILFTDESIVAQASSGEKIGLATLSSGEKHLLRILVQTLLAEDSSIIIDEPELSMHVDWQRTLIQSMRALNHEAQFIFATHSPEIMADIDDQKVFRL